MTPTSSRHRVRIPRRILDRLGLNRNATPGEVYAAVSAALDRRAQADLDARISALEASQPDEDSGDEFAHLFPPTAAPPSNDIDPELAHLFPPSTASLTDDATTSSATFTGRTRGERVGGVNVTGRGTTRRASARAMVDERAFDFLSPAETGQRRHPAHSRARGGR